MHDQTRFWRVIVPIVLIVFVTAMTLGMVCHHHGHCDSAQCSLCHLVIDQPIAAAGFSETVFARSDSASPYRRLIPRLVARQIPARAPPA